MSRLPSYALSALAWATSAALVAAGVALWVCTLGAVSVYLEMLGGCLVVRLPGWWR